MHESVRHSFLPVEDITEVNAAVIATINSTALTTTETIIMLLFTSYVTYQ